MLNAKNNWATKVKLLNSGRDATEPNTGYEKKCAIHSTYLIETL